MPRFFVPKENINGDKILITGEEDVYKRQDYRGM